jgi:hydroxylamine reductase
LKSKIQAEKDQLGGAADYDPAELFTGEQDIVSLRSTLLFGMRGMAAYAWHAYVLGKEDKEVTAWFYKGLEALGKDHSVEEWLGLLMEFGQMNLNAWLYWMRPIPRLSASQLL